MRCKWTGLILLALVARAQAQEGTYDWSKAENLADGIAYAHAALELDPAGELKCAHYKDFSPEAPRQIRLHVMRIDTKDLTLHFTATGRAEGWGNPMPDHKGKKYDEFTIRTRRETTVNFLQRSRDASRDMLVATNAQPWTPFDGHANTPYADRLGLTISDGALVSLPNGGPSLIVDTRGRLDMMSTTAETDLSGIQTAVTGFSFCLIEGKPSEPANDLHPRTGFGLCRDRRFLYLLVIDGRQKASQGATVHEVGLWLRHYGAYTGINMDGGGSTTMVRWNRKEDRIELLNTPSSRLPGGRGPGRLRANGSNFGVYRVATEQE